MTNEEVTRALDEAYRLPVYAQADPEMVSIVEWDADCEKWLDAYAPSKRVAAEPGPERDPFEAVKFNPVLERASTTPEGWVAEMEQAPDGEWVALETALHALRSARVEPIAPHPPSWHMTDAHRDACLVCNPNAEPVLHRRDRPCGVSFKISPPDNKCLICGWAVREHEDAEKSPADSENRWR